MCIIAMAVHLVVDQTIFNRMYILTPSLFFKQDMFKSYIYIYIYIYIYTEHSH